MTRWRHLAACVVLGGLPLAAGAQINTLLAQGEARANEGAQAQQRIDSLADQATELLSEYRQELKVVDGLKVYNNLLQRQIDAQAREKTLYEEAMQRVTEVERLIVPQMVSMIDWLEQFVEADMPFAMEERRKRIADLRALMDRSDVTSAEKLRSVFTAYQVESDFGRNIEAFKGTVDIDGTQREADFVRFGRVALVYQTLDAARIGAYPFSHPQPVNRRKAG